MTTRIPTALVLLLLALHALPSYAQGWWMKTGGPAGGGVSCLATNDTYLFAGIPDGGLYRCDNNGDRWLHFGLTGIPVQALAAEGPNVFAATAYNGLFRSTNNGKDWIADTSYLTSLSVNTLAFKGGNLLAGTTGMGVYNSSDGGVTWQEMNTGLTDGSKILDLKVCGPHLFATAFDKGVYRYIEDADRWVGASMGMGLEVGNLAVIDTALFVATPFNGVYRSTNYGASWTWIQSGMTDLRVEYVFATGTNLFASTIDSGLFRSTDNGESWVAADTGFINGSVNAMIASGTSIIAGTDDGLYRSTNGGTIWTSINYDLIASNISALAARGDRVIAGTYGGGAFFTYNRWDWYADGTGLPHRQAIQSVLTRDRDLYAATPGGLYRSTDEGQQWIAINKGLTDSSIYALAANDRYIFAGAGNGGGVYRSSNRGSTWTEVKTGLTFPYVYDLVISDSGLFAGSFGGLFRSTNDGDTWMRADSGLANAQVHALAAHGATLVAAVEYGVYRSTNNGRYWSRIEMDTAGYTIQSLVSHGRDFYAGSDRLGVLRSTDNGVTWERFNPGLENLSITTLAVDTYYLFAGTYGAGVWRCQLAATPGSVRAEPSQQALAGAVRIHPNPIATTAIVLYQLQRGSSVSVVIHDALGHIVAQPVVDAVQEAGEHSITIDTEGMAAGLYLCSINAGGVERGVRFVVVR